MNAAPELDAEILWKAADTLRGQINAAEYEHVVLGLLSLQDERAWPCDTPAPDRPWSPPCQTSLRSAA